MVLVLYALNPESGLIGTNVWGLLVQYSGIEHTPTPFKCPSSLQSLSQPGWQTGESVQKRLHLLPPVTPGQEQLGTNFEVNLSAPQFADYMHIMNANPKLSALETGVWICQEIGFAFPFFCFFSPHCLGFLCDSECKEFVCNEGDLGLIPGSGNFCQRRKWLQTPIFLPIQFHGQRSLAGYSPWGHKELDTAEPLTLSLSLFIAWVRAFKISCHPFCTQEQTFFSSSSFPWE